MKVRPNAPFKQYAGDTWIEDEKHADGPLGRRAMARIIGWYPTLMKVGKGSPEDPGGLKATYTKNGITGRGTIVPESYDGGGKVLNFYPAGWKEYRKKRGLPE